MDIVSGVSEDELHAYVENVLSPERRLEVERFLAADEAAARRVARIMEQRMALRAALAPIAAEHIPPALNLRKLVEQRLRPSLGMSSFSGWRAAAAAALMLGIGGASGWSMRGVTQSNSKGIEALAKEASATYAAYVPDRVHPVEFRADEKAELLRWIGNRLHLKVIAPDLQGSGYRFMGGRLVSTPHGPAGMYMYDDDKGTRLILLMRPMEDGVSLPMAEQKDGLVGGYSWATAGFGYSLAGPETTSGLHAVADEVRRQLSESI